MVGSREGDEWFRSMWQDLGFHCDFCEEPGHWRFIGSRSGLLKFRDLLDEYIRDSSNSEFSEDPYGPHDHFGPYMHLTIRTLTPKTVYLGHKIVDCEIWGRTRDIEKLARLVEEKVNESSVGDKFSIDKEYSDNNEAILEFEVREEGFDPASADPCLPREDS